MFLFMFFLALVPLVAATLVTIKNTQDAMEEKIISQNMALMSWVDGEFYGNVERIDEALTAFYFDKDLDFYNEKAWGTSWQTDAVNYFKTKLRAYLLSNLRDFITVSYYTYESGRVFHASYEADFVADFITDEEMAMKDVMSKDNSLYYLPLTLEDGSIAMDGPYLSKVYKRFDDQEVIGRLVVKLNWNLFERATELLTVEDGSVVLFLDGTGIVIYEEGYESLAKDTAETYFSLSLENPDSAYNTVGDYYVFHQWLSEDLVLIKRIPTSLASDLYHELLPSQLMIIFVTGLVMVIIVFFLGSRLIDPLRRLADSMQNIDKILEGEERPTLVAKSNDEIKVLEQSYHFMIDKIKDLIDREYKQRIETQSAQLMALQAQINPHFMYNTLQMIGAMSVERGFMGIYNVINAFSKMMRYNMQFTEEMVTMEQELTNMNQYLQIQQMRFDKKLSVIQDVEEGIGNCMLPKLSLQPVVENCFKYGFTKGSQDWHIHISAYTESSIMIVKIRDNGQGMAKLDLLEIQKRLADTKGHIFEDADQLGLKNIDARIKLHNVVDDACGVTIESIQGQYTEVTIRTKEVRRRGVL